MINKIRVLSGIRASHDSLHIGNLFGAIQGMIKLQNDPKYETFYMVADLHGITTDFEPNEMRRNRLNVAMDYLAAGIDPEKSTLFLQADVSEHAEFAYYISSAITVKRLLQLPFFREMEKDYRNHPEKITSALLNYPVLMAADILLYKASKVPIAKDQRPHLEVAREIAKKLNQTYKLSFPEPTQYTVHNENFMIPSLTKKGKMSKSKPEGAIFLNENLESIQKKIARIPTDAGGGDSLPKEGGVHTLFLLTKLFLSEEKANDLKEQYVNRTIRYGGIKNNLAIAIYNRIRAHQESRKKYEEDPELVKQILNKGAEKARKGAKNTLDEVKSKMGLTS